MPPLAVTVAVPVLSPWHKTAVVLMLSVNGVVGCAIGMENVLVQFLMSVTVTV